MTIAELRALRTTGRHAEHLAAARAFVVEHPDDAEAQIEAAYANDRAGDEHTAIRHYEEAFRIGVPADLRRRFTVGFGSTLRNVGRAEEAIQVLAQAIEEDPHYAPYAAFLALALTDAGYAQTAVATLLGCLLDVARADALDGYERALALYHRELRGELVS